MSFFVNKTMNMGSPLKNLFTAIVRGLLRISLF